MSINQDAKHLLSVCIGATDGERQRKAIARIEEFLGAYRMQGARSGARQMGTIAEILDGGNDGEEVRPDILEALTAYGREGIPTGDLLRAVLSNDLFDAMGRADAENRRGLFAITRFVYNSLPGSSWGSPAKVDAWLALWRTRRADPSYQAGRDRARALREGPA